MQFKRTAEVSVEGPIELIDGKLLLQIPLDVGGEELSRIAGGSNWEMRDDCFVFELPWWLAEKLSVGPDDLVVVDNLEGKFRITRSEANGPMEPQANPQSS